MDQIDIFKIALILVAVVAVVFFFIVSIAIALIARSRKNKRNVAAFRAIGTTTGWAFSPSVPPGFKPYLDHIDKLLKPDRTVIGSPAANFLTGGNGGIVFAVFDYDYADSMSPGMSSGTRPKMIYQKGVLLSGIRISITQIEVRRKGGIRKAFEEFVGGAEPQYDFHQNFRVSAGDPNTLGALASQAAFALLQQNAVARVVTGSNFLCVFFPRNKSAQPDQNLINAQLDAARRLAAGLSY